MKHRISHYALFISVFCFFFVFPPATGRAQNTQQDRLSRHVYTLAADSLNGRKAGSTDAARARAYIASQWREMGLKPFFSDSYEMPFEVYKEKGYCNLVAVVEGNDPELKHEYIVVGGHYDHLGVRNGQVYNGADDNASGTACVTEMARQLLARQKELKRSVIVCAFDAEEMGLYGSDALAERLEREGIIGKVDLMMSIDMVGWLKQGGALTLEGTGTLANANRLTDPKSLGTDIKIRSKGFESSIFTATDTEPFARRGIATLAVTTGLKSPYHKPEDDADLIDYEGLDRVTEYLTAFTIRASQHEGVLASGKVAGKHSGKMKKFEVGLIVGPQRGFVDLPDAAVTPKSLLGWTGGMQMQLNLTNNWALHTEVLYSHTRSRLPLADNAFGEGYRIRQESVTVPLLLQLGAYTSGMAVYLRAGGYFNYLIYGGTYASGDETPAGVPGFQAPSPYRGGLGWGIGFRLGKVTFDILSLYQLGDLFDTSNGLPKAYGLDYSIKLGYYF